MFLFPFRCFALSLCSALVRTFLIFIFIFQWFFVLFSYTFLCFETYKGLTWSLFEIIHIWTADVDESEEWSSQLIFQFKQLERRSLKKIRASTGFEPVTSPNTGAMLYRLSYEATHWERGQFIEFMSPVRSEKTWSFYEIIRIWTADVDESEGLSLNQVGLFTSSELPTMACSYAVMHGITMVIYGNRLKSSVIKLIKIFAAFTEHRHVNTRSMQIYYHNSAIVGSSDIPRKLQCFFTKCANKPSIKIVHILGVVQYTRTDSTGVIVCSFSDDSYGSWNNGWRVVQLLNCI